MSEETMEERLKNLLTLREPIGDGFYKYITHPKQEEIIEFFRNELERQVPSVEELEEIIINSSSGMLGKEGIAKGISQTIHDLIKGEK